MAVLRIHLALLLTLLLGVAGARAQGPAAAAAPGLYDRPVLVVDPGVHTARIYRVAADSQGRWAVSGSEDKTVRVWSLANGTLLRTIRMPAGPGNIGKLYAVAMSPDGTLIAAGGWTGPDTGPKSIYLFDRSTGAVVRRIEGMPDVVMGLAFSADGTRLAAVLGSGGLRIFAAERNWDEVARDTHYSERSMYAAFAPDGRLATTSYDGNVRLYASGLVGDVEPVVPPQAAGADKPFGIAFSPDGARLAVGFDGTMGIGMFDGHTLKPLEAPDLDGLGNGDLEGVAWSRDGKTLFAGGMYWGDGSRPVLAWEDAGAGPRHALPVGTNTVMSFVPLPDGELLAASADPWLGVLRTDGTVRWAHGPPSTDFGNQADKLSVSDDGTSVGFGFQLYGKSPARFDVAARKLILDPPADPRMIAPRQEGLAIDAWRDDYHTTFDHTKLPLDDVERSRSLAIDRTGDRFVVGTEWYLHAFGVQATPHAHAVPLWRRAAPGVTRAVNITGDGRLLVAAYADGTIRWHRMSDGAELLAFMPLGDRSNWVAWTPEGFYSATDGAKNILRWQINRGWDKPADSVPLETIPGYERPTLPALVLQELETPRALGLAVMTEVKQTATTRLDSAVPPGPQLHLLTIGVRTYNASAAGQLAVLHYADRDAGELLTRIVKTQGGMYTVKPQILVNDEATAKGIMPALAVMRSGMASGGGNDLAVFFFSGHGALIDGELYLLPYEVDARSPALVKATALSIDQLKRELTAIAASGRVLVLLDACHSGAVTADGAALRIDATKLRQEIEGANITVLTSSSGTEVSREDDVAHHGFFTEVLLQALGDPAADINHDHFINANGLANYVVTHVISMTGGAQTPDQDVRFNSSLFVDVD